MPHMRTPFERAPVPEHLKDTDEVYYCEITKEIFTTYDQYYERIMLLNSTVWTCSLTSRPNLTYTEALDREKEARKTLKSITDDLKTAIVLVATLTKRSGINDMVDDVHLFLNSRYTKGEPVIAINREVNANNWIECQVLRAVGPNNNPASPVDPSNIKYCVKQIDNGKFQSWTCNAEDIRRPRSALTKDKCKLFLKQCVESNSDGMLVVKKSCCQTYLVDKKIKKFGDLFIGKQPVFETSKKIQMKAKRNNDGGTPKGKEKGEKGKLKEKDKDKNKSKGKDVKMNEEKKQTSISNYTVLSPADQEKERVKSLLEEMNRRRELELQRQLAKEMLVNFVEAKLRFLNRIQDDLVLQDQKPFPAFRSVNTLIPARHFGDALMILEFIYSFSSVLEDKDKFRNNININIMERALICREVAGPLSDIIQVLLGSIFSLQLEEENDCQIEYADPNSLPRGSELNDAVYEATKAALWCKQFLPGNLNELPMDATTVTELLRIHLLMSGAQFEEGCKSWQYNHKGGYRNVDNTGLLLRMQKPHILRALSMYTIYQLPINDILTILKCLVSQILTFTSITELIEERMDNATKARFELRSLCVAERRRESSSAIQKKNWQIETKLKIDAIPNTTPEEKLKLVKIYEDGLENKLKRHELLSAKEKANFEKLLADRQAQIFAYQLYLGSDRAYRSYWLFESLPGLFIEHEPFMGKCFDVPLQNFDELTQANPVNRRKFITKWVRNQQMANNKENKFNNPIDLKELDPSLPMVDKDSVCSAKASDLMMCTGSQDLCLVHSEIHPNRTNWSFIYTEEELNALINSLNPKGIRERHLKETLENEKELILNHIRDCPVEKLQITPEDKQIRLKELLHMKDYLNANMNYDLNVDPTDVMERSLVANILEFEYEITIGHLGTLKVSDRDAWRLALENGSYDMQCDCLIWGPCDQFRKGKLNGIYSVQPVNSKQKINYEDPSDQLGNTYDIEEDDTIDDAILLYDSPEMKKKIENLSSALLQVAQSIDQKFLKEPFGSNKNVKDKDKQQNVLNVQRKKFLLWTVNLMNSRSFSQVYMNYNIISDSVVWSKSSCNATCIFCRRKSEPEKMILCDGCNRGKHLFCFKPKLTKVPEGDWFCEKCKPEETEKPQKKKQPVFRIDSDADESKTSSESDSDDDNQKTIIDIDLIDEEDFEECSVCSKAGRYIAICSYCSLRFHLRCIKPPLREMPKKSWTCSTKCSRNKKKEKSKRKEKKRMDKLNKEKDPLKSDSDEEVVRKNSNRNQQFEVEDNDCDNISDEEEEEEEEDEDDEEFVETRPVVKKLAKLRKVAAVPDETDSDDNVPLSVNLRKTTKTREESRNGNRVQEKKRKPNSRIQDSSDSDSDSEVLANIARKAQKIVPRELHSESNKEAANKLSEKFGHKRKSQMAHLSNNISDNEDNGRRRRSTRRHQEENSDSEEIPKKSRRLQETSNSINKENLKKRSRSATKEQERNNVGRRSRRTGDGLLLDNVILYQLLEDINKHEDSWPFIRPVSKHDVPDYYDVIETPMDFARIKSKLNVGSYGSNYDFMNDVQLVFKNCDAYNTSETDIYKAGVNLERFVKSYCIDHKLPFRPSDMLAEYS